MFTVLAVVTAGPGVARAAEVVCVLVEKDVVNVDGLLDEWTWTKGTRFAGANARDAAMTVRCAYDDDGLYLSVDVVDDQLVRRKKGDKGAEDQVVVSFGGKAVLDLAPGDPDGGVAARLKVPKGVAAADSLQPKGWSVEVALPRARVPGWGKSVTALAAGVEWRDADMFSEKQAQEVVGTPPGSTLVLEEGASLYKQYLDDMHIKPKDIWMDQMANMDGEPGDERVIGAGRTIGILSDRYSYMTLPVPKKDVLSVKLVDLAGEGQVAIVAHYVERGNGGSREVVAVWMLQPDGSFARPFAHEVAKESPAGRMTNVWSMEPRTPPKGKGKKGAKKAPAGGKGLDIVITVGEVRGFTAETWNESPATDMAPILLPWAEPKRERWRFQGSESFGVPE
jgi:hypothetical protein